MTNGLVGVGKRGRNVLGVSKRATPTGGTVSDAFGDV